jgi:small-conductance mechanosensitive channel
MNWNGIVKWLIANQAMLIRSGLLLAVGLPAVRIAGNMLSRITSKRFTQQSAMLISKVVIYSGNAIVIIMVLREFGFRLTTLLGAAGIAGVAIGFAAKTSLSNLISGIFLIWEKPFQVADVLDVNGTVGTVHSIDLLSVKLRTFDNKYVRIPNETLVQTSFTNITHFPIRRFDINIGVAYKEDVERVTKILLDIADTNPHCLDEPKPVAVFKGFGESSLDFMLGAWFEKLDFPNIRATIMADIKKRFDEEGIEIPFPHRTLYAGSVTDPLPIRLVNEPKQSGNDDSKEGLVI